MHAVILAGGKGTRLRPLTDTRPKPLLPFVGSPFAAGLLRRLAAAGVTSASFLVGADGSPFAPLVPLGDDIGVRVDVVTEPEPLDTAGACRDLLRGRGGEAVLVCNGDILTDLDYAALVEAHRRAGAVVTLALTRVDDTTTFGVVETDAGGRVRRFIEKPPAGTVDADTVNAGTYVLEPDAFDRFREPGPLSFERQVFPHLVDAGELVLGLVSDGFWLDLGTPDRYLSGTRAVLDARCAWPLSPDYEQADGTVLVHRSAEVRGRAGPYVVVGQDVVVADDALLRDSVVFEGASIGAGAVVERCVVAEHTTVTPGTRLSETVTAPGSVAGA